MMVISLLSLLIPRRYKGDICNEQKMRGGKSSELIVAGELIRHGLDVYLPCVDDQSIDLLIIAIIINQMSFCI